MNDAIDTSDFVLVKGAGNVGAKRACVVSLEALRLGYGLVDDFPCLCPVIRGLTIPLNDREWWENDAERTRKLRPLSRRLSGTRGSEAITAKRVRLCVTAAVGWAIESARINGRGVSLLTALTDTTPYAVIRNACSNVGADAAASDAAAAAAYASAAYAAAAYASDASDAAAAAAAYASDASDAAAADAAAAAAYASDAAAAYASDAYDYAAGVRKKVRRELKDLILACLKVTE